MSPVEALRAQNEPPDVDFCCKNQLMFNDFEIASFSFLEALGPPPWPLLVLLGSLWASFGLPLVHPGVLLGSLGPILGSSGAPWSVFWDQLGLLWLSLGEPERSLGSTWLHLEHFELPWLHFDAPMEHFGTILDRNWSIWGS